MDVWVANVSGVVSWRGCQSGGLAREDYRRLGVKLAVVLYSKIVLSNTLKPLYMLSTSL